MKRNVIFWLLWGVALLGMSGCAMTERQKKYTAAGALAGRGDWYAHRINSGCD